MALRMLRPFAKRGCSMRRAILPQRLLAIFAHLVALLLEHHLGDLHQLIHRVVGEVDVVGHARAHPGLAPKNSSIGSL